MPKDKNLSESIKEKDEAFDKMMSEYDIEIEKLKKSIINEKES